MDKNLKRVKMVKIICDYCGKEIDKISIKKINQNNLDICSECRTKLKIINENKDDIVYKVTLANVCIVASGYEHRKSKLVNKEYLQDVINEFSKEHKVTGDWNTVIRIKKYALINEDRKYL